jgi:hypothetical protein
MKNVISITEARKRLPGIIKSLKTSPDTVYQITVYDEIVAELRTPPIIKPGEAATKLLDLRKKLGRKKYRTKPVSQNINEYLYVAEDEN